MTEQITIPGRLLAPNESYNMRTFVGELIGTGHPRFPGSQPVSFTRTRSLRELLEHDYYVCEKSDGIRVLAAFPLPTSERFSQFHDRTLIDAELVVDTEADGSRVMKLLGFDTLMIDGFNCMSRALDKRLGYLRDHIFQPFIKMCQRLGNHNSLPFVAEMKSFQRSYGVKLLHTEVIPKLKHKSDGYIFTSAQAPYTPGTCDKIIKWKPSNENSVDFRISLEMGRVRLLAFAGKKNGRDDYTYFEDLAMREGDWEKHFANIEELNGRIIEVVWDPEYAPPGKWRFLRFRDDKLESNYIGVVQSIMDSISDNIELDELLAYMDQIRAMWKTRHGEVA
ncbi:hypothetical protein BX070DRAFT_230663 [Coemansia spiralis]|nr:hypothetical protein BX070DRAFT_230663 [Coemansia spiralis]